MEIIITLLAYLIIGYAYAEALLHKGRTGIGNFVGNLVLAPLWPYIMLVRFFEHRVHIAEQKRLKAYNEAHKKEEK